ncbi:CG16798 [Drosophila busckii]|uniref:CG16798 n=1 Tax=Drosophila busckii TaxID=30019 RepID=A0A0M4EBF7_DROBS|nr:uncharacterized protein LOC108602065 [Drosophila busckii]ALC38760.1 CG16798 [Drosophila busckii]
MSNKSSLALMLLLVLLPPPAMPHAARRARDSNNNDNNKNATATATAAAAETTTELTELEELPAATSKATAQKFNNNSRNNNAHHKYEIRGVAGEPNYKSVNLTWEVEFVTPAHDTDTNGNANELDNDLNVNGVTNMSSDVEPPKAFQIFYCEMQNYGPQRCRVKLVNGSVATMDEPNVDSQVQHFAAAVDNLRMATRYSFHIRPAQSRRLRSSSARADFNDENDIDSLHPPGQSIIIPTKGFSAHATQCLAHASEIEVETGPYFGGRIVVDGGDCGIKGNPQNPVTSYTMRIDHKQCGSMVKPETNTVETFITVQENLGIFTHSTRRFVVVCSYQSGMQTVRASFTVPGKNGVASAVEQNDPFEPDEDRSGRELRHMRFVDKTELVLKEPLESIEEAALVQETQAPVAEQARQQGRALSFDSLNELNNLASLEQQAESETELESLPAQGQRLEQLSTKYAKLVVEQADGGASWQTQAQNVQEADYNASLRYVSANLGSVLLTVSISVIIIGICIVLMQQQRRRRRLQHVASTATMTPTLAHLPHKTLPRALQQQQYQCTL